MSGIHSVTQEIRVQLNFTGLTRRPEEITAFTGITPSMTWNVGDSINKSERKYKSNGWRVAVQALEVEAGVDALFEQIAGQWEVLRRISTECCVELSVVIYAGQQIPPIHFREDQIRRLAELSGTIDVDVYCLGGE